MNALPATVIAVSTGILVFAAPAAFPETAAAKFGRGVAGITTGILELPGNIIQETRARGPVGVPIGLGLGLGMVVTRELVGVYELLTAPFPIPPGFRPILQPEYPWDYFAAPGR